MHSEAYVIAATGRRDAIRAAAAAYAPRSPERRLLDAVAAQDDGDVDAAVGMLRRIVRGEAPRDAAPAADCLGPILAMRHAMDELEAVAGVLEAGGWRASACAFRALVAAERNDVRAARAFGEDAETALSGEQSPIVEARVVQRLARAAYFAGDHTRARDLAVRAARRAEQLGAWRTAAAAYSIAFNVEHDVFEDFAEADRFVSLWREAAKRAGNLSSLQPALVAEYTVAVQIGDAERVAAIERELRRLGLPEQYTEHYPFSLARAVATGMHDLAAMRTIAQVLRDTDGRSRAQSAVCTALVALACAAEGDDDAARAAAREAMSTLGRALAADPAYERRLRRLARAAAAFACELLGDHVRAARIVAARDAGTIVRDLVHGGDDVALGVRGWRMLFERVREMRERNRPAAGLTGSELEVLRLLGRGWSAGRIAAETGRSVNTVYNHTRAILEKLDARRAPEAVAIARERGYLG